MGRFVSSVLVCSGNMFVGDRLGLVSVCVVVFRKVVVFGCVLFIVRCSMEWWVSSV